MKPCTVRVSATCEVDGRQVSIARTFRLEILDTSNAEAVADWVIDTLRYEFDVAPDSPSEETKR